MIFLNHQINTFFKMDGGFVYKFTIERLNRSINNRGLTLVELLAVIVILGIIASIAVPSVIHLFEKSKEDVCLANRTELKRQYELKLELESIEHTELVFKKYLLETMIIFVLVEEKLVMRMEL
jgi:prepilin-type N-terminal cleavage/methylation domain-containing protein